jgi:hypothetical protein
MENGPNIGCRRLFFFWNVILTYLGPPNRSFEIFISANRDFEIRVSQSILAVEKSALLNDLMTNKRLNMSHTRMRELTSTSFNKKMLTELNLEMMVNKVIRNKAKIMQMEFEILKLKLLYTVEILLFCYIQI